MPQLNLALVGKNLTNGQVRRDGRSFMASIEVVMGRLADRALD
jgi:hypothetical protein